MNREESELQFNWFCYCLRDRHVQSGFLNCVQLDGCACKRANSFSCWLHHSCQPNQLINNHQWQCASRSLDNWDSSLDNTTTWQGATIQECRYTLVAVFARSIKILWILRVLVSVCVCVCFERAFARQRPHKHRAGWNGQSHRHISQANCEYPFARIDRFLRSAIYSF